MKPIVILGAGGYAQEIAWIIDDLNAQAGVWDLLGFIDPKNPEKKGNMLYDRPILGGYENSTGLPSDVWFACGIGRPAIRRLECIAAEKRGWRPTALVHPSVIVAKHVKIGAGTVIGAGAVVAPYAEIGRHCAVNLQVTIGHNSRIGDFSVLSPGVRISGHSTLEEDVFVGNNASVFAGRRVGRESTLGANSFLLTDLPPGKSALGIPARVFAASTGAGTCTAQEEKRATATVSL